MRRKKMFSLLGIFLVFFNMSCQQKKDILIAEKGVLNLRENITAHSDSIAIIRGEWEFYPDRFYRLNELPEQKQYVKMPYSWKGKGIGTYHLTVLNGKGKKVLILEYIKTCYKVYINGELRLEIGKIGRSADESMPEDSIDYIYIPEKEEINIVLQVANFYHCEGGITFDVLLGSEAAKRNYLFTRIGSRLVFVSIMLTFVINLLVMCLFLKKNRIMLYFAMQFFLMAVFKLLCISGIDLIDKGFDWEWKLRLLHLAVFPCLYFWAKILKAYYQNLCPDLLIKVISLLTLVLLSSVFLSPLRHLTLIMEIFPGIAGIFSVFALYIQISGIRNQIPVAWVGLLATLILVLALGSDTMVHNGIINAEINFLSLGYVVLFFLISIATYKLYGQSIDRVVEQEIELKEALANKEILNLKIQKAIETKDEFLQRTSHEMKSPLNGIIGMAELMIEGEMGHLSQTAINQLAIIAYSGKRLNNMINNVVDASKIRLNEIEITEKPVNIVGVLEVVKILSDSELKKRRIDLKIDIDDEISVLGDEDKINQVFHNLIDNAMRHSQGNQIEIRKKNETGEFVEIVLADNGIGIDKRNWNSVFKQHESTSTEGHGLGLYISRGLCRLHGGDLTIVRQESQSGTGFVIRLKKSEQRANRPLITHIMKENQLLMIRYRNLVENGSEKKSYEIWVVDDDPANLEVVQAVLGNYNVKCFESAETVLEEIKTKKPDLVLLDIMMPDINGYAVCKKIRTIYNHLEVPVIFLTALSDTRNIVSGFDIGGNDFIVKPIDSDVMRARVRSQLSLSLQAKRWVSLREYSNRISGFHNTKDIINAVFDLLKTENHISDILVFESRKQIKRLSSDERLNLEEYLDNERPERLKEVQKINKNNIHYVLMNFSKISDFIILLEFINKPEEIDIEYLKNVVTQIKATKRNIKKIMSQRKEISLINEINKKIKQIRYIKSEGVYCMIIYKSNADSQKKEDQIRISFNSIRLFMGNDPLIQVHKGYMVNKNFVRMLKRKSSRKLEIDIDGEIIPVGPTFKNNVETMVNEIRATIVLE